MSISVHLKGVIKSVGLFHPILSLHLFRIASRTTANLSKSNLTMPNSISEIDDKSN